MKEVCFEKVVEMAMRKITKLLTLMAALVGVQLFGYRKCCYADYVYGSPAAPLKTVVQSMPSHKKEPTYAFSCGDGISCQVYLHDGDKWVVKRELRAYDRLRTITDGNVAYFSHKAKSRTKVVGFILQDFKKSNPAATVGDVLVALGL
jgi:hypothetical protein